MGDYGGSTKGGGNISSTGKSVLGRGTGGGKSSIVTGGGPRGITGGPSEGDRSAGSKRFDVTNRSLNRGRKI